LKALLIDPFQRRVHTLEIEHSLRAWYEALMCQCVDVVCVGRTEAGRRVDVWVDDEGLLRQPCWPCFKIGKAELCGYGLVLECDGGGESQGVTFGPEWLVGKLAFEVWEKRLNPADYFSQLTRVPAWEKVSS